MNRQKIKIKKVKKRIPVTKKSPKVEATKKIYNGKRQRKLVPVTSTIQIINYLVAVVKEY